MVIAWFVIEKSYLTPVDESDTGKLPTRIFRFFMKYRNSRYSTEQLTNLFKEEGIAVNTALDSLLRHQMLEKMTTVGQGGASFALAPAFRDLQFRH